MKKALVVIVLGISLMFVGGIVTAFEIPQWTEYNLEENIAEFPVKELKETFKFKDLDAETVIVESGLFMVNHDHDYDDFDDFDLMGMHNKNLPEVIIDDSIEVGTFDIKLLYIDDNHGSSQCRFRTNHKRKNFTDADDMWRRSYRNHKGDSHHDHMESLKPKKNGFFNFNDTEEVDRATYDTVRVFPICEYSTYGMFDSASSLKLNKIIEMLKEKQIPGLTHKITVNVNSKDADRLYR